MTTIGPESEGVLARELSRMSAAIDAQSAKIDALKTVVDDHVIEDREGRAATNTQLGELRTSIGLLTKDQNELEARANKIETAQHVDLAARAGSYSAIAVRATEQALEHSSDKKRAALKVVVAIIIAILTGAGLGEGARALDSNSPPTQVQKP
jgi:hypothetical protein